MFHLGDMDERGMLKWLEAPDENDPTLCSIKCYDLPFGMSYIIRSKFCRYLPFSPTFKGFPWERDLLTQSTGKLCTYRMNDEENNEIWKTLPR